MKSPSDVTAPRAPANRAYIPEPGDTDQDRLEWATNEIAHLRAELAALREPAERMRTALQEIARHRLAAEMSKEDYYDAEFEAGFDGMIGIAREALPPPPDAAP